MCQALPSLLFLPHFTNEIPRFRKAEQPAEGHKASKQQNWDLNRGLPNPNLPFLIITLRYLISGSKERQERRMEKAI